MAADAVNEKVSVKNMLFTKALPNYKIPVPTDGHKLFSCIDCGDRFIFESSLVVHINRKSLKIDYYCRYCGRLNEFFNRCQFLSHIRSHVFKTATINLCDLKIEPLPLITPPVATSSQNNGGNDVQMLEKSNVNNCEFEGNDVQILEKSKVNCFECKKSITVITSIEKDRVQHYMQNLYKFITCPVCLFSLPSSCALIAHLRIHLKIPPFICIECGMQLPISACIYPYNHDCDGFKMMRVTSRIKCLKDTCPTFHPNNYIAHMRLCHLNRIFKCPSCYLAGYNENAVLKHVMRCCDKTKYPTYFECQQCPGVFLSSSQLNKHLEEHVSSIKKLENSQLYPCWNCGFTSPNVHTFLQHHVSKHRSQPTLKILLKLLNNLKYKDCIACSKKTWFYCNENTDNKCIFCLQDDSLEYLQPEESENQQTKHSQIVCNICRIKVNENWEDVKIHFNEFHKTIKCLDLKLVLNKINLNDTKKHHAKASKLSNSKTLSHHFKNKKTLQRINLTGKSKTISKVKINPVKIFGCPKCIFNTDNKKSYESHIKIHRDPDMAYQCLECGQCFAVKPSFTTHLLLEHSIVDVNDYIQTKNCFNESALEKYQVKTDHPEDIPLEENQCNICRDKFTDSKSLQKHFRVHGMAFLMKNTQKSLSP